MIDRGQSLHLLRQMHRIRMFEERLKEFYDYRGYCEIGDPAEEARSADELLTCVGYDFASHGAIGGAVHLSIGQEAVSVGVCAHLRDDDAVVSSHRSHGHAIAKGCGLRQCLAELMGRSTGVSGGCGGSMHLFDKQHGFFGGNGIIGAQLPISLGPAFAAKYRGTDQVSVAFFGDGAANQGTLLESMNLAAVWQLPVIFVCENNLYANSTPANIAMRVQDVAPRAQAVGISGWIADGQDLYAMYEAAGQAVAAARRGGGPGFIEAKTYRFEGHCGASSSHQNPEECALWQRRDPIALFEASLMEKDLLDPQQLENLRDTVAAEMDEAVQFAIESPMPDPHVLREFIV